MHVAINPNCGITKNRIEQMLQIVVYNLRYNMIYFKIGINGINDDDNDDVVIKNRHVKL